ncbi:MAG: 16S rRNA (guanine(527)-N(7))-methyltransferase RsmG [Bacilli bacterium]
MNKQTLKEFLISRCISCDDNQINQLEELMRQTLETNKLFNLTAITDPSIFMEKMILDSAIGLFDQDLTNLKVIDVGTGAGFPGLVLYILNPEMKLSLLDATKKKIDYLQNYSKEHQYHINFINERAEEYARGHREEFDVAYARALAPLNVLIETIVPLLKVNGKLIALKGPGAFEEIEKSGKAFKKLNCHLQKIYEETLPESDEKRSVIVIVKDEISSEQYPRNYKDIKSRPL